MRNLNEYRWVGHGDDWPSGHRPCTKCNKMLPFSEYHKHSGCLHGVNTVCKSCRKVISKRAWEPHRAKREGDLYMVECLGFYKLGVANDVKERISNMQTGNPMPITLVKVWEGRADLEREVHDMLAPFHHQGEWFRGGACDL